MTKLNIRGRNWAVWLLLLASFFLTDIIWILLPFRKDEISMYLVTAAY